MKDWVTISHRSGDHFNLGRNERQRKGLRSGVPVAAAAGPQASTHLLGRTGLHLISRPLNLVQTARAPVTA